MKQEIISLLEGKKKKEELYIGKTQYEFYKGDVSWVFNQGIDTAIESVDEIIEIIKNNL